MPSWLSTLLDEQYEYKDGRSDLYSPKLFCIWYREKGN